MDFRTDKPDKEKGSKNKDKASSSRPSKPRRDRAVQRSDEEDEDGGGKDTAPRQDVNIVFLLYKTYQKDLGAKTCLIRKR